MRGSIDDTDSEEGDKDESATEVQCTVTECIGESDVLQGKSDSQSTTALLSSNDNVITGPGPVQPRNTN